MYRTGPVLTVIPYKDTVIDTNGLDPRSPYFEWCWLPLVGPTAGWAYLRMTTLLAGNDELGLPPRQWASLDVALFARSIGLGDITASSTTIQRIFGRLANFGLIKMDGDLVSVRAKVPWLARRQVDRLPAHLQQVHTLLLEHHDRERLS